MLEHACNQGGTISALIATHPAKRCGTLCAEKYSGQGCFKSDEYIARITGLRAATGTAVQECMGEGGKDAIIKVVEPADFTANEITETANKEQYDSDADGCGGGGFLVTFPAQ